MRAAIHIVIMMMTNSLSVLCVQSAHEDNLGWGCPTDLYFYRKRIKNVSFVLNFHLGVDRK